MKYYIFFFMVYQLCWLCGECEVTGSHVFISSLFANLRFPLEALFR